MRRLLAVAALCGCTTAQLHTAKRVGEWTAAGALFGMLGSVGLAEAWQSERGTILEGGIAFIPIALAGALVYAAADMSEPPPEPPREHSHSWDAAMDLAKEAKHAARAGDCAEVHAIEPRVRDLDSDVYLRFVRDTVIRTCLGPASEP